jgi:hypothetical protein
VQNFDCFCVFVLDCTPLQALKIYYLQKFGVLAKIWRMRDYF